MIQIRYYEGMYDKLFGLQEEVFKIIASRKRLEIIQLLHERELSVTEITDMLGIRQANISQHLAELRQARIVTARRDGVRVFYKLTDERILEACTLVKRFLQDQYKLDPATRALMRGNDPSIYPRVRDMVCGMRISVHHAGGLTTWNGETYYFCGSGCLQKFNANPKRYTHKKEVQHG